MPVSPPQPPSHAIAGPVLVFQGGADELQLEPGGRVYHPGDTVPADMPHAQRLSLQRAGIRFETRHAEPAAVPTAVALKKESD